jgi:hypothetical protein
MEQPDLSAMEFTSIEPRNELPQLLSHFIISLASAKHPTVGA